jgi:hypothetical protein
MKLEKTMNYIKEISNLDNNLQILIESLKYGGMRIDYTRIRDNFAKLKEFSNLKNEYSDKAEEIYAFHFKELERYPEAFKRINQELGQSLK